MSIPITTEMFEEWVTSPVTQKFFKKILNEREDMKENLINDRYENPEVVKGMCRAIALILDINYEDLHEQPKRD